jgi:hypothetical protein
MSTAKKASTELAEVQGSIDEQNALVNQANEDMLMEFFGDNAKDGRENIGADDVTIPRLSILQPMSPIAQDRESGAFAGDIYEAISKTNYGQTLNFVPLYFFGTRTMWDAPTPGAKIECIARDGEKGTKYGLCSQCEFTHWTEDEKGAPVGSKCTEFKNILVIPVPAGEDYRGLSPIVYSAKRTAIGPLKQMLTAIQQYRYKTREVPMYARMWQLKVATTTNEKGTFYTPVFTGLDVIRDVPMLTYMKGLYESMRSIQSKFDIDQEGPGNDSPPNRGDVVDANFVPRTDI